jgi:zeaxanthin glucosyltransferase
MTHYGLLCPAYTGHLNTILPLGKELQQRGHRVTLIGILDAQTNTQAAGLEFQIIGKSEFPLGSTAETVAKLNELSGKKVLEYTLKIFKEQINIRFRDIPEVVKNTGIEALLIDQIISEGGTIAEICQIPFITICT